MNLMGEIAGLATSFFFAMTALIFTRTGQMIGSQATNRVRLLFALGYLLILNLLLYRQPLPTWIGGAQWFWLSLSGVIGLGLGDAFLFQAYVSLGARLGSLLMSIAPIFAAIIAWIFFKETLSFMQLCGIALALTGVGWVILSHQEPEGTPHGHMRRGMLFGVMAALGQAAGLVLSRQGMTGGILPLQANVIRMLAAAIFIWTWSAIDGKGRMTFNLLRAHPRAVGLLGLGAMVGPVLGVSASLVAVQHAEIGVASTLIALPPVILLPISAFFFKEKVGWRGFAGTLLAISGVAVLFLA